MRKTLTRCGRRVAWSAMGTTCKVKHGDPIVYTGWDTDTLTIHCGCGAILEAPTGSGLWQLLRAYIDHETEAL